ncbi:MAG: S1C family serine protease [Solirubrobacteraceae bacterium]
MGSLKLYFLAAVIGGLVVAGALTAVDLTGGRRTMTVFQQAPTAVQTAAFPTSGLSLSDIYERDGPAVVFVSAKLVAQLPSPFNQFHGSSGTSTGSGFLVDRRGDVLTNFHLIQGAPRTGGVTVTFDGGSVRGASVIAVDQADDLAVLRVDMTGVPPVRPLQFGDSALVRVGDPTLAMGDPFGTDRTMTNGNVAALQHEVRTANGDRIDSVIQTSQPLIAGYSGGPLLDGAGRVIGVDSQVEAVAGSGGQTQQLAFAIPIDTAESVLAKVDRQVALKLAYIGIDATGTTARGGAVVQRLAKDGPAARAGLRRGDTITGVDGVAVDSIGDVLAVVSTLSPGQTVRLTLRHRPHPQLLPVVLGSLTETPGQKK